MLDVSAMHALTAMLANLVMNHIATKEKVFILIMIEKDILILEEILMLQPMVAILDQM